MQRAAPNSGRGGGGSTVRAATSQASHNSDKHGNDMEVDWGGDDDADAEVCEDCQGGVHPEARDAL